MSDILGRHINKCDLCNGEGCSQCKGKGFMVEDLDEPTQKTFSIKISLTWEQWSLLLALILFLILGGC